MNSRDNSDTLLLPSGTGLQNARIAEGSVPMNSFPDNFIPGPAVRQEREQQERHTLKTLFLLLIIICCYAMGSFSLAPHLLPATAFNAQSVPAPKAVVTVGGGACTTDPKDVPYLSSAEGAKQQTTQLPQIWYKAGFSDGDLAYVRACAASFVIAYQSFDFSQTKTFEACTAMLSTGAQQRFYGHVPNVQANIRTDPFWRASVQKQQLRQNAQPGFPDLLNVQYVDNRLLVWILVHYELAIHQNDEVFTREDDITVLAASIPDSTKSHGAWQISDWRDGSNVFTPPNPL